MKYVISWYTYPCLRKLIKCALAGPLLKGGPMRKKKINSRDTFWC
jgi:hypothetical protein